MGRPSIAIVVTYFGKPPMWLPAFLVSCRKNPDVQWFVYTDGEMPGALPSNVTVRHLTIAELVRRTSEVVGTRIEIDGVRKVCDFKPMSGFTFASDLRPFDFWAYSDFDVIWGDIRAFVTEPMLQQYDIVSSRRKRLSGHFTLFRNTPAINKTFLLIPNLAAHMLNPKNLHMDEREFTNSLLDYLQRTPQPSFKVYWRDEWTMDAASQRMMDDGQTDAVWWRDGKMFDPTGRELMYLHFHKLKSEMQTINFGVDDTPAAFKIDRSGITAPSHPSTGPAAPQASAPANA